jgi:hypothetical protein
MLILWTTVGLCCVFHSAIGSPNLKEIEVVERLKRDLNRSFKEAIRFGDFHLYGAGMVMI